MVDAAGGDDLRLLAQRRQRTNNPCVQRGPGRSCGPDKRDSCGNRYDDHGRRRSVQLAQGVGALGHYPSAERRNVAAQPVEVLLAHRLERDTGLAVPHGRGDRGFGVIDSPFRGLAFDDPQVTPQRGVGADKPAQQALVGSALDQALAVRFKEVGPVSNDEASYSRFLVEQRGQQVGVLAGGWIKPVNLKGQGADHAVQR